MADRSEGNDDPIVKNVGCQGDHVVVDVPIIDDLPESQEFLEWEIDAANFMLKELQTEDQGTQMSPLRKLKFKRPENDVE